MTPARPAVEQDHEPAETVGLGLRALDLGRDLLECSSAAWAQVRVDVRIARELDEEVDVGGLGAPKLDHAASTAVARRGSLAAPEPTAMPTRIRASPASAAGRSGSPRTTTPYATAT